MLLALSLTRNFKQAQLLSVALFLAIFSPWSWAHFLLIHTPSYVLEKPANVTAKLIFWHPMENGHAMALSKPESVVVLHRGETKDITNSLTPKQFKSAYNQVGSWDVNIPVKRTGDYVVAVTPQPYYEASEDIYIQQITKAYLNRKQVPTDWQAIQGLAVEIQPLIKPYNVLAGTTFRGVVLSNGQPVPFAEIEVEYMVAQPNMQTNTVDTETSMALPGGSMAILSDAQGIFSMALPKAGFWGFAALGVGSKTQYQGKPLSQDAVIWVQVHAWP